MAKTPVYGAAAASTRMKRKWLKKAQKMRRYYVRCRKKLALTSKPFARSSVPFVRPSVPSLAAAPTVPDLRGAGPFGGGVAPHANPWAVYSAHHGDPKNDYDLPRSRRDLSHAQARRYLKREGQPLPLAFAKYHRLGQEMPDRWWHGDAPPRGAMVPNPDGGGLVEQIKSGDKVTFVDERGSMRVGRAVMPSSHGGWVLNLGGRSGTPAVVDDTNIVRVGSSRSRASNPELLIVTNPGGRRRSRVNASMRVHGRRKLQMRRRRRSKRNLPLTVKSGGRRHTWKALVKKYGVMGAKKKWRGKKKFHGYTRAKVSANRRRRRKNSWKGQKRRHARAARKGWRSRRRRGGRRAHSRRRTRVSRRRRSRKLRRGGRVRYRGKLYSRAKLRRKIGKRRAAKLFHKRGKAANPRKRRRSRRRKN